MYQGEVFITQDQLSTFLETAELLQVRGLTGAASPVKESVSIPLETFNHLLLISVEAVIEPT